MSPSADGKILSGSILVRNLAYEKRVSVRFTFDDWETVSETFASFHEDPPDCMRLRQRQLDRFVFHIPLEQFVGTTPIGKELLFCIRYQVSRQEFWDNNHGSNYSVKFEQLLPESDLSTVKTESMVQMETLSKTSPRLISQFEDTESLLESIRAGQFQFPWRRISTKNSGQSTSLTDNSNVKTDPKKQKFTSHDSNPDRLFRDFYCGKSHMSPNTSTYEKFMKRYCFVWLHPSLVNR